MKTLTDLLDEFIAYGRGRNFSVRTCKVWRYHMLNFIDWIRRYEVETADRIRKKHLQQWVQRLTEHRTTKGLPLKPRSINKQITSMRSFVSYLSKHGYVQRSLLDVLEYVKEPKLLPSSVLTHVQVKRLLRMVATTSSEGYRNRALLELLYSTGTRIGEILTLDLSNIDLKNRTVIVMGKGNKQRVVPIGKTALRYMESYLVAVRPFLALDSDEQAVFLNPDGTRLQYHTVRTMIKKYAKQAKLEVEVTAHTFRRSCTTELLREGANMYHVKELLGHESLDTLNHYAKLTITDLKATHEKCHPRERDN